ncbi:hypothetical protein V6Z11_A06G126700 [Gossypium hirsutum]
MLQRKLEPIKERLKKLDERFQREQISSNEWEIEKKIENEIENKNECEKEKETEKESEIEGRNESAKEMSDMVKERGFENELEKERNEKDESEKERSVVTNHPMNFPCFVSTFQVSRNPIDQFQLQYFSKEKRFRLVEKGKIVDDPSPQVLKGKPCKGSTIFESSQSYLILDDEISKDLVCEKVFHLDLIGNHNLIVDKCVLHSNVKYLSAHKPIIVKIDQEVSPGKPKQKLGLCDEKLTSNLFACDDHVNYLNCGVNFSCLRVRMKYEGFDCSNVCMPNSYLLDMCEVLVKKKFSLRCETTNENRVFKPGIYIPKLTSSQARGSFVFDPGDYYSLFLLKGFGFCNFDFRDYAFRLFCGSDLFLS